MESGGCLAARRGGAGVAARVRAGRGCLASTAHRPGGRDLRAQTAPAGSHRGIYTLAAHLMETASRRSFDCATGARRVFSNTAGCRRAGPSWRVLFSAHPPCGMAAFRLAAAMRCMGAGARTAVGLCESTQPRLYSPRFSCRHGFTGRDSQWGRLHGLFP